MALVSKVFRKTHLPIYGTNLDGEHWGRCGWYGDYPGSWWQIGIKLTLMPAIIQRTCPQLQMHKDKQKEHTGETFGDWSQKVDPNRHNRLYYQPQQLYYCRHLEFQLGWYESWVPCWGGEVLYTDLFGPYLRGHGVGMVVFKVVSTVRLLGLAPTNFL